MMPDPDAEVDALIELLDDPSETVKRAVEARLLELGGAALPRLRSAEAAAEEPLRTHIAATAHTLHMTALEQAWAALMAQPDPDLEQGVFLLARYRDPGLDVASYRALLDDLARQVRAHVEGAHGFERAEILARFMFNHLGFTGNHKAYYDPNNSYLDQVLDRRTGIPISLSVVFLLLGRRLGLPVYGVNMPAHFVVKYQDDQGEVFMDIFNGGVPFKKEAAMRSLLNVDIRPQPQYFRAATVSEILLRMVRNLVHIARDAGHEQPYRDLRRLLDPWEDNDR